MKSKLPTICALDCPDTCALQITVEDGRVVKLEGDAEHPITRGFACVKMYRYPERQEHADRLLVPQKRIGGKGEGRFAAITWDEALDEIADRLRGLIDEHGGESILPYCYAGTMGKIEGNHPLAFFRAVGALELDQTVCAATGGAAWEANYGPGKLSPAPADVVDSRLIILWGINALRSNSHFAPWLKEARKRGAHLLHIDPFRNETSRFADEHWQLRVGTDAALALAIGREILVNQWHDEDYLAQHARGLDAYYEACQPWTLERAAEYCDVPLESLRTLAARFGQTKNAFIKVGYGMTRNEGGGNAVRAITLLPALTGAWQHPGGGAALSTSGGFPLHMATVEGQHLQRPGVRHVNMNELASELTDAERRIRALVVFNSNPAAIAPNTSGVLAGLRREDLLTVVLEHFQTDTADYADFLLPATTFLEHPDLYTSYGHYYLQWADPVVPARGECRPNSWIFAQLAQRLGLSDESLHWSAEQCAENMLASDHPWLAGITWPRLRQQRSLRLNLPQPFLPYSQGSHFPDGKIRFSPPPQQLTFEEQPEEGYPFRLISPPGTYILNTSLGNLESLRKLAGGQPQVMMHPDDATPLGIVDRQTIEIHSRYGSIQRQVLVSTDAARGTVVALGQWWAKFAPDGRSLNHLTSERLTDLGGGSTFGNPVVRCQPVE